RCGRVAAIWVRAAHGAQRSKRSSRSAYCAALRARLGPYPLDRIPVGLASARSVHMASDGVQSNGTNGDNDAAETREWLDALTGVLETQGTGRASYLLSQLKQKAYRSGVEVPFTANTPYINTIPRDRQAPFPGS